MRGGRRDRTVAIRIARASQHRGWAGRVIPLLPLFWTWVAFSEFRDGSTVVAAAVAAGLGALHLAIGTIRYRKPAARAEALNRAFLEERGLPLPAERDPEVAWRTGAGDAGVDDGRAL